MLLSDLISDTWQSLSPLAQDAMFLALLLLPALLAGAFVLRGFRPLALVTALLWRFRWSNLTFVLLIAVSVGIGVGLIAQERGLRRGSARAAEKFDLIVAAPGSEITMMFAAVYLQPSDVPLLDGAAFDEIAGHDHVDLAAPIAFGDSFGDAPVVGTTAEFVTHLAGGLAEGRMFAATDEAIAGVKVNLAPGDTFSPAHGVEDGADEDAHEGHEITVVGKMPPTGSPWDRAILVPVESVWQVHGLARGHAPERSGRIGPPFDADYFPGTPAVLVRADALWANYALRSDFTRHDMMAFFPGAVLAQLHALMGDVRQILSVMAVLTQVLVAAGVLTGLIILTRLFSRRLALLRALGAPVRFVFAVVWSYAAVLIVTGSLAGLAVGWVGVRLISEAVTARTDILVTASLDWPEFHLIAAFVSLTALIALLPAFLSVTRNVIAELRT
ncbi:FtsX-like permease family protein [Roseibium sp.]|uniref:FtsX-like permease family protein n=1 Tax=Roseibium sp. TaxID=1936156 RepID=UPI003D14AE1E